MLIIDGNEGGDGDLVATLASGEDLAAGPHTYAWDGRTDSGDRAPPGLYALEVVLGEQGRDVKPPGRIEVPDRGTPSSSETAPMDEPLLWLGTLALRARRGGRARARPAPPDAAGRPDPRRGCSRRCSSSPTAGTARGSPTSATGRRCCWSAAIAAAAGIVIGGWIFRRRPTWLAPALVAAMPFRIPIDLGGGDANLLLPLYAVIACGLAATLYGAWRDPAPEPSGAPEAPKRPDAPVGDGGSTRSGGRSPGSSSSTRSRPAYADDITRGLQNVAFFLAPFAALYLLLAEARWDRRALRAIVWVLAIEGLVFLLVGAAEYASGELLWNDKVISGNEAHPYFRVNSLFWDPNILGRYLAVTMTVLAAIVAYGRRPSEVRGAAACFALFLVLLVVSYSQTSTLALLAALLVLVAARWGLAARDRRRRRDARRPRRGGGR